MLKRVLALLALSFSFLFAQQNPPVRPKIGKPPIFKEADIRPGMTGYAWTVLSGTEPEAIPIEILGTLKNIWGPKQDIILAKMGGKAERTNVAAGMSGSPVYIDGKLVGAVSLGFSRFSPDAICGITPIELMLEVNDYDTSRPSDPILPGQPQAHPVAEVSGDLLSQVMHAVAGGNPLPALTPIATPLTMSGFDSNALREFAPSLSEMGMTVAAGGGSGTLRDAKPAPGWQKSLTPGEAFSGILVSGDMGMNFMCTVTYNDGKNMLGCGHPVFNLGAMDMPLAKSEVIHTLASQFQPMKLGNATEIVGALHQDRHSALMGELGATAEMVPVTVKVRSIGEHDQVRKERDLHFNVFVQQKWTPYLMMLTLFNSVSTLNDYSEDSSYRLTGDIELENHEKLSLNTMLAPSEAPLPAPMQLAGWWGERFNRLFLNPIHTPKLKSVNATIDLYPDRRIATIENAWVANSEVEAGTKLPLKVFLRPYRGERMERDFTVTIPATMTRGEHRILLSDADTLNRMQTAAGYSERFIDIPQTVSLLNQERTNNQVYVSMIEPRPTVYYEDKTLPSLPASVMNVMQTGRSASRHFTTAPESAVEQGSIPFEQMVTGSYSLKITVK